MRTLEHGEAIILFLEVKGIAARQDLAIEAIKEDTENKVEGLAATHQEPEVVKALFKLLPQIQRQRTAFSSGVEEISPILVPADMTVEDCIGAMSIAAKATGYTFQASVGNLACAIGQNDDPAEVIDNYFVRWSQQASSALVE